LHPEVTSRDARFALARLIGDRPGPQLEGDYYVARSMLRSVANPKLSSEALLILVSLADEPKHGYAMQHDIERISGRHLGPGSLYGAIARLEAVGLIEALSETGARRPYRLTAAGSRTLSSELDSMRKLAAAGMRRLAER
jgi:DNA-binding PadR family transcriptional regulator